MNALCFELAFDPACNLPSAPPIRPIAAERPEPQEVEPPNLTERLLEHVRLNQPISVARLRTMLGVSADTLQSKLRSLVAAGTLSTWTDDTLIGDGRQFVGTGQPDPSAWTEGDHIHLHPQSALAMIRAARTISVKQITKRLGCDDGRLMALLREFGRAGLLGFRQRGNGLIIEAATG